MVDLIMATGDWSQSLAPLPSPEVWAGAERSNLLIKWLDPLATSAQPKAL